MNKEDRMMPVHQFPEPDCKTSPLALLVQICSNIGAEKPSSGGKSSADKSGSGSNSGSGSSSNGSSEEIRVTKDGKDAPSCSPATSVHSVSSLTSSNRTSRTAEDPAPGSKRNTPSECRSSPLALGRASAERRATPSAGHGSPGPGVRPKSGGDKTPTSTSSAAAGSSHDSASDPACSSGGGGPPASLGLDFSKDLSLSSYKAGLNGLNPLALANCSGCSPVAGHIPLDSGAAYPLGLKGAGYSFGPYMNYAARLKSGVCRDPYCANCQLAAAQLPYPDRLAAHMAGLYPAYPVPGFARSAGSAFAAASSVLPRPNICSWMVGDSCCNKSFASSEELMQHLRTHTSLAGAAAGLPMYSTAMSLPSALAMEACGLYTTPSLTTPAGLRRTYPTSLSPVSSLSAAGRYHPYKPPGLSPLSAAPLPPLGHPGLSFYNPYSGVYGKG